MPENLSLALQRPIITRFPALRRALRFLERAWVVILLYATSGAYFSIIEPNVGGNEDLESSSKSLAILLLLYAVIAFVILKNPKAFARAAWRAKLGLLMVGLACLSTLWSVSQDITLRRATALLAPTALGLVLSFRFTLRELLRLVAVALGIAVVMSLIVGLVLPGDTITLIDYGSAWRGVYENKNSLGRAMAFAVPVFVLVALDQRQRRWPALLACAGALALIFLARSAGSLVPAVALLMLIPVFRLLRLRFTTTIAVGTVGALLMAICLTIVAVNAELVFAMLGRDPTLTGRVDIWEAVLSSIWERPWLGYGYSAFWQVWSGPSASVLRAIGWEAPNSHNGFLDLWVELGLVGVLSFLLGFAVTAHAALMAARRSSSPASVLPLILLSYMVLINVSMSYLLTSHSLSWILYIAIMSSDLLAGSDPASLEGSEPSESTRGRLRWLRWTSKSLPGTGRISPGVRRSYRPPTRRD